MVDVGVGPYCQSLCDYHESIRFRLQLLLLRYMPSAFCPSPVPTDVNILRPRIRKNREKQFFFEK